jgi:hypothetical protein
VEDQPLRPVARHEVTQVGVGVERLAGEHRRGALGEQRGRGVDLGRAAPRVG